MPFTNLVAPDFYDVTRYGAVGDGTTDNTSFITDAETAVNASGGGVLYFGPGTFITGPRTLYSNILYMGAGSGATTIKLKNGANADLFSAHVGNINLAGASGTGSSTAISGFGFRDLTLDGNCANQTGGPSYPLRFYGYGYTLDNIHVKNGYSGGIQCDYYGPYPSNHMLEYSWNTFRFMDNQGISVEIGGSSDGQWTNGIIANNNNVGSHLVHVGPNASGLQATNVHLWRPAPLTSSVGALVEGTSCWINCEFEGSDTCNFVMLANRIQIMGGRIFAGGKSGQGIQIGQQAGLTPYAGSITQSGGLTTSVTPLIYLIMTTLHDLLAPAFNFASDGAGVINSTVFQTSSVAYTGTINGQTEAMIRVRGLTPDGTAPLGGVYQLPISSGLGLTVLGGGNNSNYFSINTFSGVQKRVELPNGAALWMYSDNYATKTLQLMAGTVCYAQSATAPAITNNGTITTAGVGIARIAPTGNVTGIILQAGTQPGQRVTVRNESAFTVTFDAVGISSVADGTASSIPANCSRAFEWNSSGDVWSRFA